MNRILVTGATGNVGRQVVSQLLTTGAEVRALTRDPESARLPRVEIVRGDLTMPETLGPCLENIGAVFLVWTVPASVAPTALDQIARHARQGLEHRRDLSGSRAA